jgi:hypothetical protein
MDSPDSGVTANWCDLRTKGFVHAKSFLTEHELTRLRDDYQAQATKSRANGNYDVPLASPLVTRSLEGKLAAAAGALYEATGVLADMTVAGLYFATEKGVNFAWHQDHESYFLYQQHSHYLNFYIPIIKPDPLRTNICLVPFDALESRLTRADYRRLVGSGASRFMPEADQTWVSDDEQGEQYTLPLNLESLRITPQLDAGDLLLMRGDMIHRTEDTSTDRVAISFRRTRANAVISKTRFFAGADSKRQMIQNNRGIYAPLIECFESLRREEVTAKQLASYQLTRGMRA